MPKVSLYIVTFNSPPQLQLLLDSISRSNPELLKIKRRFLIDNSTDDTTKTAYDAIVSQYDFKLVRKGNLGICGARQWAAKHFGNSNSEYILWFEDDMLMVDSIQLCKNGLNQHVEDWISKCISIIDKEKLDFLKLSFSEYWGDHHEQWAWHNLPLEEKSKYFPADYHRMQWKESGSLLGLSYLIGEVFYSNWPSLMTKTGNKKIFLDPNYESPFEQTIMSDSFKLLRAGKLRSGVLMASLVNHNRVYFYQPDLRKEA